MLIANYKHEFIVCYCSRKNTLNYEAQTDAGAGGYGVKTPYPPSRQFLINVHLLGNTQAPIEKSKILNSMPFLTQGILMIKRLNVSGSNHELEMLAFKHN